MKKPNPVWLFRITHIDNLDHVLKHGLVTESSPNANPNFKKIGDSTLIDFRKDLSAPDPPGGCFRDYIPFYFGPRSPMLYQIATGWEDIEKIGVYNQAINKKICRILAETSCNIQVITSPKKLYYDHL